MTTRTGSHQHDALVHRRGSGQRPRRNRPAGRGHRQVGPQRGEPHRADNGGSGWHFNRETDYPLIRDSNSKISVPDNVLKFDTTEKFR
jgi:hypothetical protein